MTYTYLVQDCTSLSYSCKYQIAGESGQWHYSYSEFAGRYTYYTFWRYSQVGRGRKITRRLAQEKVYEKVTELSSQPRYKPINLHQLESFQGK